MSDSAARPRAHLVEGDQAAATIAATGTDVFPPDRKIRLGDAGIRGQNEENCMGIGQQGQCELGFRADRIETRRVQDHQTLFEQGVRKANDRVAPARDLDQTIRGRLEARIALFVDREAKIDCAIPIDPSRFPDAGECAAQAFGRVGIEVAGDPFFGVTLEFCDAGMRRPGVDRQ